ncbi:MAG: hypothetical protein KME20_02315 [Kaiparowitsia implicata GSE-PSE-MK54-09C]|nr:hypothetical protein [Kaiparowitsia implicata GSE-PSE-MK54-09C]
MPAGSPGWAIALLFIAWASVMSWVVAVARVGRSLLGWAAGLILFAAVSITIADLVELIDLEAGYIPFAVGNTLAILLVMLGEAEIRLLQRISSNRAVAVVTGVAIASLTLGWVVGVTHAIRQ